MTIVAYTYGFVAPADGFVESLFTTTATGPLVTAARPFPYLLVGQERRDVTAFHFTGVVLQ